MWMMAWMVLFWAVVIGGGAWLFVAWRGREGEADALNVLQTRLARGEIDVQEFEDRAGALRRSDRSSVRGPLIALAVAVVLVIAVPTVIMAANGWDMDMWSMHGRGEDTASDPAVRGGREASVRIEDFAFEPGNLEVPVGARVTWTNEDSAPHDATAASGDWNTRRLGDGESDTLAFETAGTFAYVCSIHPNMKARLTVRE